MQLFYRKLGQGKPLFILHGLFGSSDNWQTLAKRFAEKYEVYLIDQRNHGQSFHSEEWNYQAMSNDILSILQENNLKEVILLGHSMGGKAAMHFSIQHPEKVIKLIVVDIAPKYYPVHHNAILDALNSLPLTEISSRKEAESWLAQRIKNNGELQFLLKSLYWKDVQSNQLAWRFNLEIISQEIEIVGEAQNAEMNPVSVSTLFVRGEKSDYITHTDLEGIHKSFANAQIITIQNAGHWVQAEQPVPFFEAVNGFLNS